MNLFAVNAIQILLFVQLSESVVYSLIWNVSNTTSYTRGLINPVTPQIYCTKDRQCGRGYCHKHFSTCHKCKSVGQKCRRDHVCCKGFECVFGSCRKIVKAGNYLSRCRKDKHCNRGLCCAKSHGEFVCKYKLKKNRHCNVLAGGVGYTVNHNCPCEDGLVCMRKLRRKRVKRIKLKTEMRCQKIT